MQRIEWTASWALGIDEIDDQHRGLIDGLNDVRLLLSDGQRAGNAACIRAFDLFGQALQDHFAVEEAFCHRRGLPGAEGHANGHDQFLRLIRDCRAFAFTDQMEQAARLVRIVERWLVSEIRGCDSSLMRPLTHPFVPTPIPSVH